MGAVNMDEHEGWQVLSRALLHIWQGRCCYDSLTVPVLDHCRRLILAEAYPENDYITGLLQESTLRIARERVAQ